MVDTFDAIVIGSGQAGPSLAARLAGAGRKVALVEQTHLGGTCVNDGCMPTKTMVASARVAHLARRAADFGVRLAGDISVYMPAVIARKNAIVQGAKTNLAAWLGGIDNLTLVWGTAGFVAPHAVAVGGRVLEAGQIFINTGGRAVIPNWPGLQDVPFLTNTTLMELTTLPAHLIVAGGSYTPILNAPQSGILGMHKIQDRPVAIAGKVEVRPMMYVALSYDHRIVDGREAVTFLVRIKECLEDPVRLVLDL